MCGLQYILVIIALLLGQKCISAESELPPISFKYVENYELIWKDEGSSADRDVSIWRPIDNQYGYYPLGDVAVASHKYPTIITMTVTALESDALKKPASCEEVWNDKGSGADEDVTVYKLTAPFNYTCLGHVAVESYDREPDLNNYRCVKSIYLTLGSYDLIWNDEGSHADNDVGLWSNSEIGSDYGVFSNTFTSKASHRKPTGNPYLLHKDYAKLYALIDFEAKNVTDKIAIKLYEGTDSELIWNDKGSGGKYDVSIFRSEGPADYFSLGDIAIEGFGDLKVSYVAKSVESNALREPVDYRERWNDKGSGSKWDGSVWEPVCPGGYVSLGHVAVKGKYGKEPKKSDVSCVLKKYVTAGKWEWVWNDKKTGSNRDVTIWRAVAKRGGSGQGVYAMSAVARHGKMDRDAYVLKSEIVQYVIGQPATKYVLQNVEYLFDDRKSEDSSPEELARTIVENRGTTEQTSVRSIEYSYEETHDWSKEFGLEIGVETSVTAGIPSIGETSATVSTTTTTTQTWGESTTESKTDTIEVEITVQPMSQKTATVVSNRYIADIPYTATLITTYADGSIGVRDDYSGVYRGVQVNEVRVVLDEDVPLQP